MRLLVFVLLSVFFHSSAYAEEIKLWCHNDSHSLIFTINKDSQTFSADWGSYNLFKGKYSVSQTSYNYTVMRENGKNVKTMAQLDRRSLRYEIITPLGDTNWQSEGQCVIDPGPKI